jgi:large subunit ribosomal protein L31e
MAAIERQYTIPLRREWLKVPKHKRANKAMKAVIQFLSKHMKAEEADIRVGRWLNEEVWGRGMKYPPHKIRINASKDDKGIVKAEIIELSERAKKVEEKEAKRKAVIDEKKKKEEAAKKAEEEKAKKEAERLAKEEAAKQTPAEKEVKKEEAAIKKKEMHDIVEKKEPSAKPHEHKTEKGKQPVRNVMQK